jgi:hypothetical protein
MTRFFTNWPVDGRIIARFLMHPVTEFGWSKRTGDMMSGSVFVLCLAVLSLWATVSIVRPVWPFHRRWLAFAVSVCCIVAIGFVVPSRANGAGLSGMVMQGSVGLH